ncbi:MAG: tetratricopeptide repeat protein [Sandaracinus sp.]|nr:tetratricopeptide repeat protein [Sandaracinus sp.]MCB9616361.1 tetratricopeptide repeat protein [Sandaracinus sp.]MCB9635081.1 tetratricopeptide repeat protein [Sandaracinus sp.]
MNARLHALVLGLVVLQANGARADALTDAERALVELRVEEAERAASELLAERPRDARVLRLAGLVRFHRGDYARAVGRLEASLAATPQGPDDDRAMLLDLMRSTRDATQGFEESRSEDGRFVVLHAPGRDRALVPYALEAMRRADEALRAELGVRVPGPIRLEIFGSASELAKVSTLTEEAIATTGTIALCKWDKLMVTSPRALLRGYPWMDTIAHEYVHLVLSRASRDHAPVWLQEGVAKFLERRWREPSARPHLGPAMEAILHRAARENRLIAFDRIHPSIALLPSQEDAALAFAQVATFVARFYADHGAAGLQAAVARIAEGTDARRAIAEVAGTTFEQLERRWRDDLRSAPAPEDAPRLMPRRLRGGEADEVAETSEVNENARRALRLGDLLWARRRFGAAAVEYGRAHERAPDDPIVASRLARAAIEAGDAERAVAVLEPLAERYPEHAPTQAILARGRRMRGDESGARDAATAAIRLNPFDPMPHCDLALVERTEIARTVEADQCRLLGGEVPMPASAPTAVPGSPPVETERPSRKE